MLRSGEDDSQLVYTRAANATDGSASFYAPFSLGADRNETQRDAMFRLKCHRSTVTCAAAERVELQQSGGGYFRRENSVLGFTASMKNKKHILLPGNVSWRLSRHQLGKYERGNVVEKRLGASLAATSLRLGRKARVWEFLLDLEWDSPELSGGRWKRQASFCLTFAAVIATNKPGRAVNLDRRESENSTRRIEKAKQIWKFR